jgi:two-component system KDP operon response regulator KdpE
MPKASVLIVEDDPAFARLISLSLGREGFKTHVSSNGEDALDLAAEIHPDVVVLDLTLPGMDGYEVLAELRERRDVPVLVVTGAVTPDQVRLGLDRGADDYIRKPFAPAELAARLRAVLRRGRPRGRRFRVGEAIVDLERWTIEPAPGADSAAVRPSAIGRGGWRLLETLLANEGKILYRDELLVEAFGSEFRGDSGYLQDQIRRLRRGLGIPPWLEGPIRTIHGVGYAFDPTGEIPVNKPRRPRRRVSTEPARVEDDPAGRVNAETGIVAGRTRRAVPSAG